MDTLASLSLLHNTSAAVTEKETHEIQQQV